MNHCKRKPHKLAGYEEFLGGFKAVCSCGWKWSGGHNSSAWLADVILKNYHLKYYDKIAM